MRIEVTLTSLSSIVKGKVVYDVQDSIELKVSIYSELVCDRSVFIAVDSKKYDTSNGALGFSDNEDSVFGLGGYKDGHEDIEQAINNGAKTIIVEKMSPVFRQYSNDVNVIIVEDSLTAIINLARYILETSNIKVIGVTGSMGKTTTINAIYAILSQQFSVQKFDRIRTSYLSLALDIICNLKTEADFLLVEMQIDGPKQIASFCSIARPNIAIITGICWSHLKRFNDKQELLEEKLSISSFLGKDGILMVNCDDDLLFNYFLNSEVNNRFSIGENSRNIITYSGLEEHGRYRKPSFTIRDNRSCHIDIQAKLNCPGYHNVYASMFAYAVGIAENVPIKKIKKGFLCIENEIGRMELFKGLGGSLVVSDSYNASIASIYNGLNYISRLRFRKKILILGSMMELGAISEKEHSKLGNYIIEINCFDTIICIGEASLYTYSVVKDIHTNSYHVFSYNEILSILKDLKLNRNTVIYVKGAGALRLELLTTHLLAKKII